MVLINAQAANHDVDHFGPSASIFNPERWLTNTSTATKPDEKLTRGIQHFSFGAGSRACSGQIIASRLIYTALIRILSCYRIVASESQPPNTDYVDYNEIKSALVAIPRAFKVRLVPRDTAAMEKSLNDAEERTRECYAE